MASPVRVNLNRVADPKTLLDAVDIPTPGGLPVRATCPHCLQRSLSIHEDNTFGGVWHHCSACGIHGDGIELAATTWECSPGVAVRRLAERGVPFSPEDTMPAAITAYTATYPQRRQWLERFWTECRTYLNNPVPLLNQLRVKFKLQSTLTPERWAAGPGQLLGGNCRTSIETLGHANWHHVPGSVAGANRRRQSRTVLPGHGWQNWQEALVVPFYDLPGRICGFQFVGSSGRDRDRVFHSTHAACMSHQPRNSLYEGGLAGWPMIGRTDPDFGKHVAVCDDAYLGVRLQVRHAAVSNVPLPLLAFCDVGHARTSRTAWRILSDKVPVFWGFKLTASLLHQAMMADGMLTVLDVKNSGGVDHYIRDNSPRDLLARVVRQAMPWRDRFALWAEKRPAAEIEQLFIELETYGEDLRELRQMSPRLKALVQAADRPKTVRLGQHTVVERNDKWWLDSPKSAPLLVLNAAIRIDGSNFDNTPAYHGRVFYEGTEIPFRRGMDEMLAYPTRCFNEIINTRHANATLYCAPNWATKLIPLGMQFAGIV